MYMSANMLSGLTSLLDVNTELTKYQTQATTGKRINQASDGLASYVTAQGLDTRATRLQMMNDGLSSVLSTVSAAKAGLDQITKTLTNLRSTLKAASETQAAQGAQGVMQLADSDPGNAQFSFTLSSRLGRKDGTGAYATTGSLTTDTLLYQAADSNTAPADTNSQVFLGGQAMREGLTLKFSAGDKTWSIKVGRSDTTGVIAQPTDDAPNSTTTVYTVGQLLSTLRDKLNINTNMSVNFGNATVQATYTGPQFGVNNFNGTDLTAPKRVTVAVDYTAIGPADGSNKKIGYGAKETYDIYDNKGYMNANVMFTSTRQANNSRVDYVEDQKKLFLGSNNTEKTDFIQVTGNRFVIDKANNDTYNATQTATFQGIQHNFQAAVDAKTADPARANAAKAYRQAVVAINTIVSDSTTQGINLLYGNLLTATLNESGQSVDLQITTPAGNALSFTATRLGLVDGSGNAVDAARNFATNNDGLPGLMTAIGKIDNALILTQSGSAQVASFQATLQDRKDFNSALVKMLNQSSQDLVGADATEVAAKTSALQIQQSFGQSILSSTKQAEQSLLQLLR